MKRDPETDGRHCAGVAPAATQLVGRVRTPGAGGAPRRSTQQCGFRRCVRLRAAVIAVALVGGAVVTVVQSSPAAAATVAYYLPWSAGTQWKVSQGNNSAPSHTGNSYYALDFIKASGSTAGEAVLASAPGTVVRRVINITGGTGRGVGTDFGNHIVLKHADGRCTLYAHMQYGSVTSAATVGQGAILGRAGNTGFADGAHLHFGWVTCPSNTPTVPGPGFVETGGATPTQGQVLTSRNGAIPPAANPATFGNRIVQWNGDSKAQKTAWLVSGQLKRYWIPDGGTFNCLRDRGYGGPDVLASSMLDQLPDQPGHGATCGGDWLGVNRLLLRNTYIRSNDGRFSLWLQSDGNLVLYGPSGVIWANGKTSDMLILQSDGNLVTYKFTGGATWVATWASGTSGSGSNRLVVQTDGNLVLYSPTRATWTYRGRL